jgi:GT2 family glycosyltransferase/glycosyltransferase involved in cell wall biosynthesis
MVIVSLPVFNEVGCLEKTISSVLGQTFQNFELIISDNHSSDGSSDIIAEAVRRDARVRKVSPPTHMKSLDHGEWLLREVLNKERDKKYSIFIGGHDLWEPNLLQVLWDRAEREENPAIVYSDAYEIDDSGSRLRQYCGWVMAKEVPRPFVPHHILLGLTHNIATYGLWSEEKRKQTGFRHSCAGADHLLVAEMALLGSVLYEPGTSVYLGKGREYGKDIKLYARKHLSETDAVRDFAKQMEWAAHLVDKAVEGDALYSQDVLKNLIKTSLLSAYASRYISNLTVFENGVRAFFDDQTVQRVIQANNLLTSLFSDFLALAKMPSVRQGVSLPETDSKADAGEDKGFLDQFRGMLSDLGGMATSSQDAKPSTEEAYLTWLQKRQFDTRMAACYEARIPEWRAPYVFHVVVLLVGDEGGALSRTIKSLAEQYYYNVVISVVTPFEAPDGFQGDRLHWLQVGEGEIVAGVNTAVERVTADWVTVVNAGDTFPLHVFLLLGEHVNSHPDWRFAYTDEDSITPSGFDNPYFKPDINVDMLRALPYVGNALFARRDAFLELGGWAGDLAGAEGYDLLLKALERYGAQGIGHVADVLYHRQPGTGYAERLPSRTIAANTLEAVKRHLARQNVDAAVEAGMLPGSHRVRYRHAAVPLVSIIIPTKDELPMLQRCIESLLEKTRYPNYEILVVDNASQTAEALAYLEGLQALGSERVRVLRYEKPFNFSAMNNLAAKEARGEYLLLLNNDTAVLEPDWLDEMMSHAQRPEVGVVGARLLFPNRLVQHAGVVLGMGIYAVADHPFIGFPAEDPGYWGRLELTQNYSAVTAACLVVRKALYDEMGGLEEKDFKVLYNDVDFCLKVREKGYLAVWTPHATLLHEGSASQRKGMEARPDEAKLERIGAEQGAMWKKWLPQLANDPAFNPNLSLRARAMVLEVNTALCWDPLPWRPLPYVLVHPADNMGCGKYRIADPVRALSEAGIIQGAESFTLFSPPEIERIRPVSVVLQRQVTPGQVLEIEKLKKYHPDILRVYELDDLITRLTVKNPHRENMPKDVYKMLRKGVALCDRFIVSTARLAEGYKGLHADIRVMPNTLRKSEWGSFKPLRRQGKKARVGWAGGLSHVGDLELIADVVAELADKVEWVFLGLCPDTLKQYVKEHHPGVETPLYPAKLASLNLDLAIAPLEINEFNECKSHLKLLEYGILGYPVVCTDILPYQGDYPVKRVPNRHKAWVDAILERANDLDAAAREGDALREYVLDHWMIENHLEGWKKAWLP